MTWSQNVTLLFFLSVLFRAATSDVVRMPTGAGVALAGAGAGSGAAVVAGGGGDGATGAASVAPVETNDGA